MASSNAPPARHRFPGNPEWVDALESVLAVEGPERAHFLLEQLVDKARRSGAYLPVQRRTPRTSTPSRRTSRSAPRATTSSSTGCARWCAGTRSRWCCAPASRNLDLGGHIASFASAATLYDVGFNHFWRAPTKDFGGDLDLLPGALVARRLRPRLPRRAADARRSSTIFRQEVDGKGISSYPHPWLMPDFWQFPTVSMGLGPHPGDLPGAVPALPARPRARQHRGAQGLGVHGRRRDGRARVAGRHRPGAARGARQPDLRRQLQPAAPRRPGARQRQDHPGARGGFPRRRLERDQGRSGAPTGIR